MTLSLRFEEVWAANGKAASATRQIDRANDLIKDMILLSLDCPPKPWLLLKTSCWTQKYLKPEAHFKPNDLPRSPVRRGRPAAFLFSDPIDRYRLTTIPRSARNAFTSPT